MVVRLLGDMCFLAVVAFDPDVLNDPAVELITAALGLASDLEFPSPE